METKFLIRFIIFFAIYGVVDVYYIRLIQTVFKKPWLYLIPEIFSLLLLSLFIVKFIVYKGAPLITTLIDNYAVGGLLAFTVFKLFILLFLIPEDIYRIFYALYSKIFTSKNEFVWITRRKFVSQIAMGVAAVPFTSLIYGVIFGRYDFRVIKHVLFFEDLPEAFEGYQITQISDIHSGSFDNKHKVSYAVDLINSQQSNVILFTGDIVNNRSNELLPWLSTFSKLKANDGVFSILGNHDYGDYAHWDTKEQKNKNLENLKQLQKGMGFDLLLNEHRYLEREGQKIALVGVENWGVGGFKKAGDLHKAQQYIKKEDFKILMSHDPTHWQEKVIQDDYHYHLTLSGHTHGMQFGIEIPGVIKWSPSSWKYKYWAGLYKEQGKYINVNRGLGYIGYPGRFGIWPEISVLELRRKTTVT